MKQTILMALFSIGMIFNATAQQNKDCKNAINLSTPTNWLATGSPAITTTTTTFYGHTNWMQLNSPVQQTNYQFKRVLYICRAGKYTLSTKGMGNNHMILNLDGSNLIFDRDINKASGFNTPTQNENTIELTCGKHELNVSIADDGDGNAGFYLDATLTSSEGCISEKECPCQIKEEVCRCPKGWLVNITNEDGGIAPAWDKSRCKKLSCKPMGITPLPPNGTMVGTLGFTWNDELWFWGTQENGGEAKCTWEWVNKDTKPTIPNTKKNIKQLKNFDR